MNAPCAINCLTAAARQAAIILIALFTLDSLGCLAFRGARGYGILYSDRRAATPQQPIHG